MSNRSSRGTSYWLQSKDKVILDDEEIILHDFVPINNIFLHGSGDVSTQNNSVPFPWVQQESARILLSRRLYQRLQQGREQFKAVYNIDEKDVDGKIIKWSDVLNANWDSPELYEAELFWDKFVFGYLPDLSILEERLRNRLHDFLKCIFTVDIEQRY